MARRSATNSHQVGAAAEHALVSVPSLFSGGMNRPRKAVARPGSGADNEEKDLWKKQCAECATLDSVLTDMAFDVSLPELVADGSNFCD